MSTQQNKELMRRMVDEVFNKGNLDMINEFMAPNFVEHEELPAGIPSDREGVKGVMEMMRSAFPDFHAQIDDLIAEDDKVVMRMTWTGTHQGEFMGVPPTGKSVSFGVLDVIRMADGMAVEHWGQMDSMGLMQQLGAVPGAE